MFKDSITLSASASAFLQAERQLKAELHETQIWQWPALLSLSQHQQVLQCPEACVLIAQDACLHFHLDLHKRRNLHDSAVNLL